MFCRRAEALKGIGERMVELNCAGGSAADAVAAETKQSKNSFAFISDAPDWFGRMATHPPQIRPAQFRSRSIVAARIRKHHSPENRHEITEGEYLERRRPAGKPGLFVLASQTVGVQPSACSGGRHAKA
jgi:hypothetical protein